MNGWIKLHRNLVEKPIWLNSTPEQKVILITLLCMVNHEPKQWEWKGQKYTVESGQTITSIQSIVEACGDGVTSRNVRTALVRFENLGFLTNESTNKGRLITIENWGKYQHRSVEGDKETDKHLTSTRQAGDKQTDKHLTTNKNDKKYKNNNKERGRARACAYTREGTEPRGKLKNVWLTDDEYLDLKSCYENVDKHISEIGYYLANASREYENHYAFILKIAQEDNWPRRRVADPDPQPERKLTPEEEAERIAAQQEAMEKIRKLSGKQGKELIDHAEHQDDSLSVLHSEQEDSDHV